MRYILDIIIVFAILSFVGCVGRNLILKTEIEHVLLKMNHFPGFVSRPGLIRRFLFPSSIPEAQWELRISSDGIVEQEYFKNANRKKIYRMTRLTKGRLDYILYMIKNLSSSNELSYGLKIEDAPCNWIQLYDEKIVKEIGICGTDDLDFNDDFIASHRHFLELWHTILLWYPPPKM